MNWIEFQCAIELYLRTDCVYWTPEMTVPHCTCLLSHVCVHIAGTLGCVFIDNETHESGVTKCTTGEAWSALSWHHSSVFHCQWIHNQVFLLLSHMLIWNAKSIFIYVMKYVWFHLKVGNSFCSLYQVDWQNLMKQLVTVGAQLLWVGRYGCNNGRYGCTIVMSYIEINKAVSQWLLTFNLCVCHLTFNLCVSHTLHAHPWNHWYAQRRVW